MPRQHVAVYSALRRQAEYTSKIPPRHIITNTKCGVKVAQILWVPFDDGCSSP